MDLEEQSQGLRAELKQWEHRFARQNKGAKPGRSDIKQNPDIAQKYKLYNKIRDMISGKSTLPKQKEPQRSPRKRKSDDALPSYTPSKRRRTAAETPSNRPQYAAYPHDAMTTPSTARKLFSPACPTSIGPTPQRDGRVLGLFDHLDPTPQGPAPIDAIANPSKVEATPSKSTFLMPPLGRTPSRRSDGKLLSTPLTTRHVNIAAAATPSQSSVSKLAQFATPSFLRRAPLPPPIDENGEYIYSPPRRLPRMMPRKPPMRGLSSVVASLRKLEEEKLDDDLDILREMEGGDDAAPPSKMPQLKLPGLEGGKKVVEDVAQAEPVVVEDSQVQVPKLLGGFDDEGLYDSEPERQVGRDGAPLRVYKKKGQKRTTRRSNMKPVFTKRPEPRSPDDADEDSGDEVVPETQHDATKGGDGDFPGLLSGSEFGGDASDDDADDDMKKSKKKAAAKKGSVKVKDTQGDGKKEGAIKKAVRKVSATAHQNFKRLKLRNHGAKGGPGHNSRFRRRR